MESPASPTPVHLKGKMIMRFIFGVVFIFLIIFIPAGRLDYVQGWLYLGINVAALVATYIALRHKTDLVQERLKAGPGMKSWDKVYFIVSTPLWFIMVVVGALDAGRFQWGPRVQPAVVVIGAALFALGQGLFLWAKAVNRFFSAVVRIQTERGQTVVRDGPYRFVRHPGYLSGILFGPAGALVLGSFWALIPAVLSALLLVVRTGLEDKTLRAELPGYSDYARQVRFRLVPGIW
jgi:protein-S-isoprenylcysteine O-methyltransferase Ste14